MVQPLSYSSPIFRCIYLRKNAELHRNVTWVQYGHNLTWIRTQGTNPEVIFLLKSSIWSTIKLFCGFLRRWLMWLKVKPDCLLSSAFTLTTPLSSCVILIVFPDLPWQTHTFNHAHTKNCCTATYNPFCRILPEGTQGVVITAQGRNLSDCRSIYY